MGVVFNPIEGEFNFFRSGGPGTGDGTIGNPFTLLNVKKVLAGTFHTIGENLESVVTVTQQVDGVLTVDGVNTIL